MHSKHVRFNKKLVYKYEYNVQAIKLDSTEKDEEISEIPNENSENSKTISFENEIERLKKN